MNTLRHEFREEEKESSGILIVDDIIKNIQVSGPMLRKNGCEPDRTLTRGIRKFARVAIPAKTAKAVQKSRSWPM